jgi:hypothetical protein
MTDAKRPDRPKPPSRSNPLKPREMTHSLFGFLDNVIQRSVDEARDGLAQTKKRLGLGSPAKDRESTDE